MRIATKPKPPKENRRPAILTRLGDRIRQLRRARAMTQEALAEMVDWLVKDTALRQRIIARQRERVQAFLAPQVKRLWEQYLQDLV